MAWRIVEWSNSSRTGAIGSPHFDAIPFDSAAVPKDAVFSVGDEVTAILDGNPGSYVVRNVRKVPTRAEQQPDGTEEPLFEWLNSKGFGDLRIDDSSTPESFALWVGDCCEWCGEAAVVRFHSTHLVIGLSEDTELDEPYFRRATDAEIGDTNVPSGHEAYFVVLPDCGPEQPAGFVVVAKDIEIERRPCTRRTP